MDEEQMVIDGAILERVRRAARVAAREQQEVSTSFVGEVESVTWEVLALFGFTVRTWRIWVQSGLSMPPRSEEPVHPFDAFGDAGWDESPLAHQRRQWENFGFHAEAAHRWVASGLPVPPPNDEE